MVLPLAARLGTPSALASLCVLLPCALCHAMLGVCLIRGGGGGGGGPVG